MNNAPTKAFELIPPRSPEDVARDNMRATMPQNRRAVSQLKICAQAKWLFCQITDDTFLFQFGGDGYGSLYTSIKEMSRRYRHDRDSIAKWLGVLEHRNLVWCEHEWPNLVIHVSAVVPNPQGRAGGGRRIRAMASAAAGGAETDPGRCAEGVGTPLLPSQKGQPARKAQENRTLSGDVPARRAEDTRTVCPHLPHDVPTPSAHNGGQLPHTPPTTPATCADTSPHDVRKIPAHLAEDARMESAESSSGRAKKPLRESLPKTGGLKVMEGVGDADASLPPPQGEKNGSENAEFDAWKAEMRQTFASKREKLAKELSGRLEQAENDTERAFFRARLAFLKELRLGGKPPKPSPKPKIEAKPASVPARTAKTEAQLVTEARKMIADGVEIGIPIKLPPAHEAALRKSKYASALKLAQGGAQ